MSFPFEKLKAVTPIVHIRHMVQHIFINEMLLLHMINGGWDTMYFFHLKIQGIPPMGHSYHMGQHIMILIVLYIHLFCL